MNVGDKNIKPAYTHDLQLDYTANIKSLYIDVFAKYENIPVRAPNVQKTRARYLI